MAKFDEGRAADFAGKFDVGRFFELARGCYSIAPKC